MSDRRILEIVRRHTGENPKETGIWPHEEILEMIAAAQDRAGFSAQARADILYVVYAFGGNQFNPKSDLLDEDKKALCSAAVSGIETAAQFRALSPYKQTAFVRYCVLQFLTDQIGFTLSQLQPDSIPAEIANLTTEVYKTVLDRAGASKFDPASVGSVTSVLLRNGEPYCYVLNCSFAANDNSGEYSSTVVLGFGASFFRTVYEGFDPNEPDEPVS